MYDVVIIGGGAAGLSAAIYAKRALLEVLLIDKSVLNGGQIINTNEVDNYLGFSSIGGMELAMAFVNHADSFGIKKLIGEVKEINTKDSFKLITMNDGTLIETKTIILATGASYRKLNVSGEDEYRGRGVSYCATCDGAFFRDKDVAVVGGGDVALEDCIYLSKICNKIYLINRRKELRGSKHLQEKLKDCTNVEFLGDFEVQSISGSTKVESIDIKNNKNGEQKNLLVNGVFIAIGMIPENNLVKDLVELDDNGYVVAGEDTVTSDKSIFAVGDVRTKPLRQIITAAADGAVAITSVEKYLNL